MCVCGYVAVNYMSVRTEHFGCRTYRMAGDDDRLVQEYKQMNKTAFVLGYTGVIGKELVKTILSNHIFTKVVLIGRRTVTYDDELYKDVVSAYQYWL